MKTILSIALGLLALLPLHAQNGAGTLPDFTPGNVGSSPDPGPATSSSPGRNIMPQGINHKPNPTNPPAEIAGLVDKLFKGLEKGDYANAYEGFLSGTRLGSQKQKMSDMISRTEGAFGIYGKMNDYEIFDNYGIGSNVLVLTYLSRHEVQPLRWRFIFYRADKNWALINMGFDDVLLDMLD